MSTIRIVLIEDHDLTRVCVRAALQQCDGVEVVGEAANRQRQVMDTVGEFIEMVV